MHHDNRRRPVIIAIMLALLCSGASAQVAVKLRQPPPNQLEIADLWRLTITNPTTSPIEVRLIGAISEATDGSVVEARTDLFVVTPGVTYVSAAQLGTITIVRSGAKYRSVISGSGVMPVGRFTACVSVVDAAGGAEIGRDCLDRSIVPGATPDGGGTPNRPEPLVDPCTFGNWDFETGSLCRWYPSGEAFTIGQPSRGNPALSPSGAWYISTTDAATGTLRSDTFELATDYMRFLIGGGGRDRGVAAELHVIRSGHDSELPPIVLRAFGEDSERMTPAELDVRRFIGMRAFVLIVDAGDGSMEHINVDRFEFTDEPLVRRIKPAECDLVNWSFETSTLHCWESSAPAPDEEQNAFVWQPIRFQGARGPGAPAGAYWIHTGLVQLPPGRSGDPGSKWLGSLTSKLVTLDKRWITFELGGGFPDGTGEPGDLRVELLVADESSGTGFRAVRAAIVTGDDRRTHDELRRVAWSVADLAGQQALIRIIDSSATGFIACDDFAFTDAEPMNWDFEQGLDYWTATGTAFREQPTVGATIPAARARPPGFDDAETARIGGDYWNSLTHVGHHLDNWIGTAERRSTADAMPSSTPVDTTTGMLVSREIILSSRYITFLIGGSKSQATTVELVVDSASAVRRTGGSRSSAWSASRRSIVPAGFTTVATIAPTGSEMLRRVSWDVGDLIGARAYIVIIDNARDAHINVDDFLFANELRMKEYHAGTRFGAIVRDSARDDAPELWGFGDFHTHPMAHLGSGGLLHGEPVGAIARALRACDGLSHAATLALPISRSMADVRTIARLLLPFVNADDALPVNREGLIDIPQLMLRVIEGNAGARDGHVTHGMPDFNGKIRFTGGGGRGVERGWPGFASRVHQRMHRDWIRRAWGGGLRIMCALAANSEAMSVAAGRPQTDAEILTPQLDLIKQMARDNAEWMEIAYSAHDARRIIGAGKLAVVLGVELDGLEELAEESFERLVRDGADVGVGTDGRPTSDAATTFAWVDNVLERLTSAGVRHILPVARADNAFGGAALTDDLQQLNGYYLNGRFSAVADGAAHNVSFKSFAALTLAGLDRPGLFAALGSIANDEAFRASVTSTFRVDAPKLVVDLQRAVDSSDRFATHVNALGLTDAGRMILASMMRRGLLIDLDNMGARATDTALGILERNDYPVVSGQSDSRSLHATHRDEGQHTDEHLRRIARLGGVVGAGATGGGDVIGAEGCQSSSWSWLKEYEHAIMQMPSAGIGIGTDMNAFSAGPGPRFGPQACSMKGSARGGSPTGDRGVLYKHYAVARTATSENVAITVALPASRAARTTSVSALRTQPPMSACSTGTRTFDFNTDGLAHIGLLPDMIQDCRNLGMTHSALRLFMGSAESFVRMWERAEMRSAKMRATTGPRR